MNGIHHVIVNVKSLERSREFYAWLLPKVGYPACWENEEGGVGWLGAGGSFWIKAADARFSADDFHKDRVGLCEVAFRAERREDVDALGAELVARGAVILDPPREYDYVPGYYAVFFADPDGMKSRARSPSRLSAAVTSTSPPHSRLSTPQPPTPPSARSLPKRGETFGSVVPTPFPRWGEGWDDGERGLGSSAVCSLRFSPLGRSRAQRG